MTRVSRLNMGEKTRFLTQLEQFKQDIEKTIKGIDLNNSKPKKIRDSVFPVLHNFLSNIPCINSGGCAVAALIIQKYMGGTLYYKVWNSQKEVTLENLKDNTPYGANHVIVKINKKFYDCNGVYTIESKEADVIKITDKNYVILSAKTEERWNEMFDSYYRTELLKFYGLEIQHRKASKLRVFYERIRAIRFLF